MLDIQDLIIAGRYRLLHRLRRGGMSEVFLANDEQAQQQVALKLVSNTTPDDFKRLQREVRVLRKLSHAHILPILDYGEWEGYAYLVMPYIKHGNLRDLVAQGPLTQEEAGSILSQVASALQCAHDYGILHRDIKASNILMDSVEDKAIYLADFGLAKAPGEGSDVTQTGCLIGTPEYMAPELVTMPESTSSDIYALGILLYLMLTGKLPFTAATPIATCWKHVEELPPLPSAVNPCISPEVEAVILRAIEKDPACRFPDVQSMAQAYEQALALSRRWPSRAGRMTALPARITHRKMAQRPTMSTPLRRQGQRSRINSASRKALLTLAMLVWIGTSLSLGFMVGHTGPQESAAASVGVSDLGQVTLVFQPKRADPPTQQTPSAPPAPAAIHRSIPPAPPPPPHKHDRHHHGHDRNNDGNGDGEEVAF
jgi:serine/threonine protein kinase